MRKIQTNQTNQIKKLSKDQLNQYKHKPNEQTQEIQGTQETSQIKQTPELTKIIKQIKNILQESIDYNPDMAKRFFKTGAGEYAEFDKFLGIKTPILRKIAKKYQNLPCEVIETFLQSAFNEERLFALIILVIQYKRAKASMRDKIYQIYLKNIRYVNNWNLVDNSAYHIIGAYLWKNNPEILLNLASSKNLWERRIAIVATWYFIKQQDFEYTIHIVKLLINDSEDLIHKACGWMLREVGKHSESVLINFLDAYANLMPRTMLRYAIEKFPESVRKRYSKVHLH